MDTDALQRLATVMRTVVVECPHGHRIDGTNLRLIIEPGVGRKYVDVFCRRCPSYRGRYRVAKLADKLAEEAAAGHYIYRLAG